MAAFYIILDHFKDESENDSYSSNGISPNRERVKLESNTDFANAVNGKYAADIWPVIDELMMTLQVLNPRLYAATIRLLKE